MDSWVSSLLGVMLEMVEHFMGFDGLCEKAKLFAKRRFLVLTMSHFCERPSEGN